MRKRLIAVLLFLTWLCQAGDRYVVMLEFYLNQSYIAQNLCENRARPQLQCNGNCVLSKKLAEEQKKQQEVPQKKTENKAEIIYLSFKTDNTLSNAYTLLDKTFIFPISIGHPIDQSAAIFHPPIA
jgi:hypothetical protein